MTKPTNSLLLVQVSCSSLHCSNCFHLCVILNCILFRYSQFGGNVSLYLVKLVWLYIINVTEYL